MLPEAIKKLFYEPYVFVEGENTTTGNLSIEQLNKRFSTTIKQLKEESKPYHTATKDAYYVLLGSGCSEPNLIQGSIFYFDFSVKISSLSWLKIKVRASGVPTLDRVATAVELEKLFERGLSKAERRLRWYAQLLTRIRDPMDVSNEILVGLLNSISARRSLTKQQYLAATTEKEAQSLRFTVYELDRRLKFLAKVLVVKGSL